MTVTVPAGLPDPPGGSGELWWIPALAGHGGGGAQGVEMLLSTLLPQSTGHWVRGAAPLCTSGCVLVSALHLLAPVPVNLKRKGLRDERSPRGGRSRNCPENSLDHHNTLDALINTGLSSSTRRGTAPLIAGGDGGEGQSHFTEKLLVHW